VATQDPVLRARFGGAPEYVVRFLRFVSEELREYMAELGFRTLDEMVGRVDRLEVQPAVEHWKAKGLDFSAILLPPDNGLHSPLHCVRPQEHEVGKALDYEIMALARSALDRKEPVRIEMPIRNVHRSIGAALSGEITRRYGAAGLPTTRSTSPSSAPRGRASGRFLPPV